MGSDTDWISSGDDPDFYQPSYTVNRAPKRRKLAHKGRAKAVKSGSKIETHKPLVPSFSFSPLLQALHSSTAQEWRDDVDADDSFETIIGPWIPEYEEAERQFLEGRLEMDETRTVLQPLSRESARHTREQASGGRTSVIATLLAAKSRTHLRALRKLVLNQTTPRDGTLTPLLIPRSANTVNPQILDALYAIETTPYECSFLSRLQGYSLSRENRAIAVDWETRAPWMELMSDIREHYTFAHPEREQPTEVDAPIAYCSLQPCHLPQIHDLLARAFWEGIDVSDALEYSPEKCTIVATYKQLVVGAAFLSSPQETYITYLVVRAGWDNSQIATSMLYHLITLNPHKDITLHVSITNPAMLLYNRFGFKAEGFIVGFYEDYLDPNSPQSKNAFRLRLRR
ncbi:hypothetical protein C8Q79DRAFT_987570 [Trametes meyenii]|nr:hypothetical protein C8Q79DRAFT_987570 [Trametes meyenii]